MLLHITPTKFFRNIIFGMDNGVRVVLLFLDCVNLILASYGKTADMLNRGDPFPPHPSLKSEMETIGWVNFAIFC